MARPTTTYRKCAHQKLRHYPQRSKRFWFWKHDNEISSFHTQIQPPPPPRIEHSIGMRPSNGPSPTRCSICPTSIRRRHVLLPTRQAPPPPPPPRPLALTLSMHRSPWAVHRAIGLMSQCCSSNRFYSDSIFAHFTHHQGLLSPIYQTVMANLSLYAGRTS